MAAPGGGGLAARRKEAAAAEKAKKDKRNSDWDHWTSPSLSQIDAVTTLDRTHDDPAEDDVPKAESSSRIFPMPSDTFTSPAPPPHYVHTDEENEGNAPILIHSIGCPFMCAANPPSGLSGGPCDAHCPCYKETPAYEQHPCYGVNEQNLPTLNDGHCLTTIINYCCWDDLKGKMMEVMREDMQFCRNLNYHPGTNTGYQCPASKIQTCGDTWMAVMPNANHSMYLASDASDTVSCVVCSPAMVTMQPHEYRKPLQWMPVMVHDSYFILRHISNGGMNCLTNGMSGVEISECGLPGDEQLWILDEKTGALKPKTEASSKKCLAARSSGESSTLHLVAADGDACPDKTISGGDSTSWVICTDISHCDRH